VARREHAYILEIGMVQTHVHILARIHPTLNVSRLAQRLKALSSTVANTEHQSDSGDPLYWAKGYSATSVSPGSLENIRAYLRKQPSHHPNEAIHGWPGDLNAEYDTSSPRSLIPPPPHPT
jgi:putative transposase